jgi:SOS-response transcriptional repressor LexA
MRPSDRVKLLIYKQNQTQKKFSENIGISPARLNNYLSGRSEVPQDILVKISRVYKCSLEWLLTGDGDMYGNTESSRARVPLIEIPVISSIAAGSPLEVVDDDEPHETIHIPANKLNMPPPYYAFRVNGESMYPYIWDGDIVILSRDWRGNKINGRICGFRTPDGITLKRLVLQPKQKTSWLMPLNPTYNPTPYNKDTEELALFGVLVLSIREYK